MVVDRKEYGIFENGLLVARGSQVELNKRFGTNVSYILYVNKKHKYKRIYDVKYLGKESIEISNKPKEEDDLKIILNHFELYGNIYYPLKRVEKCVDKLKEMGIKYEIYETIYDKKYVILSKKG